MKKRFNFIFFFAMFLISTTATPRIRYEKLSNQDSNNQITITTIATNSHYPFILKAIKIHNKITGYDSNRITGYEKKLTITKYQKMFEIQNNTNNNLSNEELTMHFNIINIMVERNNKLSYEKIFEKIVIENKTLGFSEHFVLMFLAFNIQSYKIASAYQEVIILFSLIVAKDMVQDIIFNYFKLIEIYLIQNYLHDMGRDHDLQDIIFNCIKSITKYSTQNCLYAIFYNKYTLYNLTFGFIYYYIMQNTFFFIVSNAAYWVEKTAFMLYLKDIVT